MTATPVHAALSTFTREDVGLRVLVENDEPWFVAADVCSALTITNTSDALKGLDEDEKMTLANPESHSGSRGGSQSFACISESGLYSLIIRSRKPEARPFRRWVTHEVLPALRKDGHYEVPQPAALSNIQAQITELRTVIESKATRVAAPPALVEKMQLTELSLDLAYHNLGEVLEAFQGSMRKFGIHRIGERSACPPLADCTAAALPSRP